MAVEGDAGTQISFTHAWLLPTCSVKWKVSTCEPRSSGVHSLSVCFTLLCSWLYCINTPLCSQALCLNTFTAECASDLPWLLLWLLYDLLANSSSKFSVFKGCLWVFWFTSREDLLGVLAFRLGRTPSSTDTQKRELPVQVLSWGNSCSLSDGWWVGLGMVQLWLVSRRGFKLIWKRSSIQSGGFSLHWGEQAIVWSQGESFWGHCAGERHSLPFCCLLGRFYLSRLLSAKQTSAVFFRCPVGIGCRTPTVTKSSSLYEGMWCFHIGNYILMWHLQVTHNTEYSKNLRKQ